VNIKMKSLAIAVLLGLVKVDAYRMIDASTIQLKDDDQENMIDDSDVVIQIYDSNLENANALTPPSDEIDEFVQTRSNMKFRPFPEQSPWAASPTPGATNDITGAYTIHDDGSDYYSRKVPEVFDSSDRDDLLMRSVISNYAVEGKSDGGPNGKFFITRSDMNSLADEVLSNNMGFTDSAKKQAYAEEHVPKIWKHFDVFGNGYLPVE